VRHYEVDAYGHVNHANYVHYLEAARVDALTELGLPLEEMRRLGYLIVVTELSVRFLAPAHPGDTLEILTHIREIQGARSRWVQHVRSAADQRALVTAELTGAFVNEAGRPVRIPEAFRAKLAALHVPDGAGPP
jgi:acyl-CoA thioester hydrolase